MPKNLGRLALWMAAYQLPYELAEKDNRVMELLSQKPMDWMWIHELLIENATIKGNIPYEILREARSTKAQHMLAMTL
jgi:hypothetical protein